MRIEAVHAAAFGPFIDRRLELAPGMTIVFGPNESGKSSWHAALYAGLCGMRRARGRPRKEDEQFDARHRPWDAKQDWRVQVTIALHDGRRIELHQDLADLVDCRATDLTTGRDISDEIMVDGAPDGAVFLGLTRRTLLPTLWVRQADVLGILENADELQEALQRAAATGGADATAEQALERLRRFRTIEVGTERPNSTRPLMQAVRAVRQATDELQHAQAAHAEYLQLLRKHDDACRRRDERREHLDRLLTARRHGELVRLRSTARELAELSERFADGPPPDPANHGPLADAVAEALVRWEHRPEPEPAPDLPSEEQLRAELATLPDAPQGDVAVHPSAAEAYHRWTAMEQRLQALDAARPDEPDRGLEPPLPPQELRQLADVLATPLPAVDDELRARVDAVRQGGSRVAPPTVVIAGGAALCVVGAALSFAGVTTIGTALFLLGALVAGGGLAWRARSAGSSRTDLEARLAVQEAAAEEARRRQDAARQRLESSGLPIDPERLRQIARHHEDRAARAAAWARWQAERERVAAEGRAAAAQLFTALTERGEQPESDDPSTAYTAYAEACRRRQAQATAAARAETLRAQLDTWRRHHDAEARRAREREEAEATLRAVAARAGVEAADPDVIVHELREWQDRSAEARAQEMEALAAWTRLQHLQREHPVEELHASIARLEEQLAGANVDGLPVDVTEEDVADAEAAWAEANKEATELAGRLSEREQTVPDVTAAEEALEQAQAELARLRGLSHVLDLTERFLNTAKERVHRDIAPRLQESVARHLPHVTNGRYEEVAVDPERLHVRVRARGGPWRDATRLSHGTAEQIYLLLRVALAEHLCTSGEPAPLILDDVTVQSDATRTRAILDVLHELSSDHQVIVFTQEEEVAAWAEANLTDRDRVVRLDPAAIAA